MRMPTLSLIALGIATACLFAGCPWSSSPNVFEEAKGISLPTLGGPPKQSEPPLPDEAFPDNPITADNE